MNFEIIRNKEGKVSIPKLMAFLTILTLVSGIIGFIIPQVVGYGRLNKNVVENTDSIKELEINLDDTKEQMNDYKVSIKVIENEIKNINKNVEEIKNILQ